MTLRYRTSHLEIVFLLQIFYTDLSHFVFSRSGFQPLKIHLFSWLLLVIGRCLKPYVTTTNVDKNRLRLLI